MRASERELELAGASAKERPSNRSSASAQNLTLKRWTLLTAGAVGLALLSWKVGPFLRISQSTTPLSAITYPAPTQVPLANPKPLTPEQQVTTLLKQADRQRQQRQYAVALANYDKVIKLKPKTVQAYWGRCDALTGLKRPGPAVVACNDALALNPDYAEALWSQGKALKLQDRSLEALSLFEQATALKPTLAEAWVDRGITLQEFGRSSEAIDVLDQAIALNRNSAEAWSTKGAALWNLGRFDQAIEALDKALQIQPKAESARALRQLAREQLGY